ncbi:hypothetical protein HYQ44_013726 [Verticillium longisporum]|nr:hypothetical protein HYQ44_013726 [Verticillium longisporum]
MKETLLRYPRTSSLYAEPAPEAFEIRCTIHMVEQMRSCETYQIHLISDEIHVLSVWGVEGDSFVMCLSADREALSLQRWSRLFGGGGKICSGVGPDVQFSCKAMRTSGA